MMIIFVLLFQLDSLIIKPSAWSLDTFWLFYYRSYADCNHLNYGIHHYDPWHRDRILNHKYFVIDYNDTLKIPNWVAYYITAGDLMNNVALRSEDFRADVELPCNLRAEPGDYERSGYDRGHNAPAGDFARCQDAMSTTFLLSNMSPQVPELNRESWMRLEKNIRTRIRSCGRGWIITGNLFLDSTKTIGHGVGVPSHCYKAVLLDSLGILKCLGSLMPNSRDVKALDQYWISVDSLETLSGYDFFFLLPDSIEQLIEK